MTDFLVGKQCTCLSTEEDDGGEKGMEMELRPESIPHIPYTFDRLYSKHMILFSSTVS
jgi:hypothetical protein